MKSNRRSGKSSRRAAPSQRKKAPKLKTADKWWEDASNKNKRDWTRAWFAENGHGVLQVLRIETKICRGCGGQGYTKMHSTQGAEEVKIVCKVCNLAQHERLVICR